MINVTNSFVNVVHYDTQLVVLYQKELYFLIYPHSIVLRTAVDVIKILIFQRF